MHDTDRFRFLFGPYAAPRCRVGRVLTCAVKGRVVMRGLSDALIPWPFTRHPNGSGRPSLIVCGDLLRAVRRESEQAVAHGWGVSIQTVWAWRKALGVPTATEGTQRLRRDYAPEKLGTAEVREKVHASTQRPERNAKIAQAKQGKARSPETVEKMRQANRGKKLSAEIRQKLSAAQKRRGAWPPAAGRPFTPEEDALLGTAPDRIIAEKMGRHWKTLAVRRRKLGVRSFRGTARPCPPRQWAPQEDRLLGTMPDPALARQLGCTAMMVFNRRRKRGIPAYAGKLP